LRSSQRLSRKTESPGEKRKPNAVSPPAISLWYWIQLITHIAIPTDASYWAHIGESIASPLDTIQCLRLLSLSLHASRSIFRPNIGNHPFGHHRLNIATIMTHAPPSMHAGAPTLRLLNPSYLRPLIGPTLVRMSSSAGSLVIHGRLPQFHDNYIVYIVKRPFHDNYIVKRIAFSHGKRVNYAVVKVINLPLL